MTALFTRVLFVLSLSVALVLNAGLAEAQKAKPVKPKKAVPAEEPVRTQRRAAAETNVAEFPGFYYVLIPETEFARKEMEVLRSTGGGLTVVDVGVATLFAVSGDPGFLHHVKAGYPEFLWLTSQDFDMIAKLLQQKPEITSSEYAEKLKKS